MKKIFVILMVLTLVTSLVPMSMADDSDDDVVDIDQETTQETEIMDNYVGAYIRLLQLEKVITKNILKGEGVVSVLSNLDVNTTTLEAILAELELLKEEVQSADPNASDVVQIFIDLKNDSIELSRDFRQSLHDLVNASTLKQLRERMRTMVFGQVQNISKKLQNQIRLHNRNQLYRIYGYLGDFNETVLQEYLNGNITKDEVKNQISKMVNQMIKEKKNQFFSNLKEYKIRLRIQSKAYVENVTENFQERKQERLKDRLNWTENFGNAFGKLLKEEIQNRIRNKINETDEEDNSGNEGQGNENSGVENNGNGLGNSSNGYNNSSGGSGN